MASAYLCRNITVVKIVLHFFGQSYLKLLFELTGSTICSRLVVLVLCVAIYGYIAVCACFLLQMAPIGYAVFTMSNVVNAIGSSLTLRLK